MAVGLTCWPFSHSTSLIIDSRVLVLVQEFYSTIYGLIPCILSVVQNLSAWRNESIYKHEGYLWCRLILNLPVGITNYKAVTLSQWWTTYTLIKPVLALPALSPSAVLGFWACNTGHSSWESWIPNSGTGVHGEKSGMVWYDVVWYGMEHMYGMVRCVRCGIGMVRYWMVWQTIH